MHQTSRPARPARFSAARAAGWLAAVSMIGVAAFGPASSTALAATVDPSGSGGNVTTCPAGYSTIFVDGTGTTGTDGSVTVTLAYVDDTTFSFSATGGVIEIVFVKGGNGYNTYDYRPNGVS